MKAGSFLLTRLGREEGRIIRIVAAGRKSQRGIPFELSLSLTPKKHGHILVKD